MLKQLFKQLSVIYWKLLQTRVSEFKRQLKQVSGSVVFSYWHSHWPCYITHCSLTESDCLFDRKFLLAGSLSFIRVQTKWQQTEDLQVASVLPAFVPSFSLPSPLLLTSQHPSSRGLFSLSLSYSINIITVGCREVIFKWYHFETFISNAFNNEFTKYVMVLHNAVAKHNMIYRMIMLFRYIIIRFQHQYT